MKDLKCVRTVFRPLFTTWYYLLCTVQIWVAGTNSDKGRWYDHEPLDPECTTARTSTNSRVSQRGLVTLTALYLAPHNTRDKARTLWDDIWELFLSINGEEGPNAERCVPTEKYISSRSSQSHRFCCACPTLGSGKAGSEIRPRGCGVLNHVIFVALWRVWRLVELSLRATCIKYGSIFVLTRLLSFCRSCCSAPKGHSSVWK